MAVNYDEWFSEVEQLAASIGISGLDKSEEEWSEAYHDGCTPEEAIKQVVTENI